MWKKSQCKSFEVWLWSQSAAVPLSKMLNPAWQKQLFFPVHVKKGENCLTFLVFYFNQSSFSHFCQGSLLHESWHVGSAAAIWFISGSTPVIGPSGTQALSSVLVVTNQCSCFYPQRWSTDNWFFWLEENPDVGRVLTTAVKLKPNNTTSYIYPACGCVSWMCVLYWRRLCLHRPVGVYGGKRQASFVPSDWSCFSAQRIILTASQTHTRPHSHIHMHTHSSSEKRQTWKTWALHVALIQRIPGVDIFNFSSQPPWIFLMWLFAHRAEVC